MGKDDIGIQVKLLSDKIYNQFLKLRTETDKNSKSFKNLEDAIVDALNSSPVLGFAKSMEQLTSMMIRATQKQTDYIENLHMLQAAYGETNSSGEKLVSTMADLSGLDISGLTKSLGQYRQLTTALGMNSDTANLLSENLLKMTNDIASLYNMETDVVSKKLMSALTGETKAIKILGADVTNAALQQKAYNLGITESVTNMSSAEKTILRYLTIFDQLKNSQGDFANTINSVANQTKIWNSQLDVLKRQLGASILPILETMLPVLNGILMAVNTIIGTVLGLFGISYNIGSISDEFLTLESGINGVTSASEKANKSLRGFDKLNVIKTPTSSSSSSSGVGGGIDSRMLAALQEYNDGLLEANNKARKIRNTILEWFGYTEDTNGALVFSGKLIDKIKIGLVGATLAFSIVLPVLKLVKSMKSVFNGLDGITGKSSTLLKFNKNIKGFSVPKASTIIKGLKDVALIIGGVGTIILAIGEIRKIPNFDTLLYSGLDILKTMFSGLGSIAIPLAATSALVGVMGNFNTKMYLKGLGDLALIVLGTEALILAVGYIRKLDYDGTIIESGISTLVKVFNGIGEIIIPLALLTGLSALAGIGTSIILPGLAVLAAVVSATSAFIAEVGAIVELYPNGTIIESGIQFLIKVFDGIGQMFGALVGGILEGAINSVASTLPFIGTKLSEFSNNANDFFKAINSINESSALGAKYLAQALLYIAEASVIDGLRRLVGFKTIDFSVLPEFATNMKEYARNLGSNFNSDIVTSSANAAKSITEIYNNLPKGNGWLQNFIGEKSLDKFSKTLPEFGENLKSYYNSIKGIDSTIVTNSASAAKSISELYNNLPKSDGFWQKIFGQKSLSSFGEDLKKFGEHYSSYASAMSSINTDNLNNVNNALTTLVNNLISVKNNNLSSVATTFGVNLKNLSSGITSLFKTSISKSDSQSIASKFGGSIGTAIADGIKSKLKVTSIKLTTKGLFGTETLGTYSLKAYASGGFPDKGDIFLANEKTPEYVGSINNKPAVANNNQIVDGISTGVARAMMSIKQTNRPVVIEAQGDTKGLLDFIDFKTKEDDRQYGL